MSLTCLYKPQISVLLTHQFKSSKWLSNLVKYGTNSEYCFCQQRLSFPNTNLGPVTSFSRNYRAAVFEKLKSPLSIKEMTQPKLEKEEVRVAVHHCAVNMSDLLMCKGLYENTPKQPFVPGFEFCGEVLEIGTDVKDIHQGDKVIGLAKEYYGGLAEQCVIGYKDVWKVPQSMPSDKASALADGYATVLLGMRRTPIEPKDYVLVTASSGGLGLAAIDIAANLYKAKVIAACGTEDKASLVRDKGAFHTVNYNKKEIISSVKKLTKEKGVKVIFEAVGGDITGDCLQCIAHEGSIIVAGFASRRVPHIPTSLLLPKSIALIGISLTQYRIAANKIYRQTVEEVIEMYKDEFIDPHISATFKLEQINEAFKFIEDGHSTGQVVVDIQGI